METWKKIIDFLSSNYYAVFFYQTESTWGITSVSFRALGVNNATIVSLTEELREKNKEYLQIVVTNIIKL